jgi:Protein of unknown function (DUF2950)
MKGREIMDSKLTLVACALVAWTALAAPPRSPAKVKQAQFDSAKKAADALIQVAASFDPVAAKEILGPGSDDLVSSEDPIADKNQAHALSEKAKEKLSIEPDKKDSNRAIIRVGNDGYTLPIPLVKRDGKWSFDTKSGAEEIRRRRVGANELNAIAICRGYVEAQREYAVGKHDDSKINQYAQKLISSPGKHDGLAWKNEDGSWGGPVGPEVANALQQGYTAKPNSAYHGYYFKILKAQGPAAPMGEMDFVVEGAMIGGFALAGAPADYRVTGVKTFIVGADGKVYEKDLGKDTLKAFQAMDRYNPDKTWQETSDDVDPDNNLKDLSASAATPSSHVIP